MAAVVDLVPFYAGPLLVLIVVATIAVTTAFAAVVISRLLPKRRGRQTDGQSQVGAELFYGRVRYISDGPIAAFIIVFTTIVAAILILFSSVHGGK